LPKLMMTVPLEPTATPIRNSPSSPGPSIPLGNFPVAPRSILSLTSLLCSPPSDAPCERRPRVGASARREHRGHLPLCWPLHSLLAVARYPDRCAALHLPPSPHH
jgi:hypothetical protein